MVIIIINLLIKDDGIALALRRISLGTSRFWWFR